jgi:hypothetical protein
MSTITRGKVVGYMAALFVAGAVSGALLTRHSARPHNPGPGPNWNVTNFLWSQYTGRLKLTPDQQKTIEPYLCNAAAQLDAIRTEGFRKSFRLGEDLDARIESVLTPEQKPGLEEIRKEHQRFAQRFLPAETAKTNAP